MHQVQLTSGAAEPVARTQGRTASSPAVRIYDASARREARRTLVQRAGEARARGDDPRHVHAAAREGLRAAVAPLPYLPVIQRAFGRHAVENVRAHRGPLAEASTRAMGAAAFTRGEHVVLGAGTGLRTVAHEAAHVVQQRAGVRVPGGVGRVGDPYERHADAVASRVVTGGMAEGLLDRVPGRGGGTGGAPVQRAMGLELEFPINVDGLGKLSDEQEEILAGPVDETREELQKSGFLDKDITMDEGSGFKITPDHQGLGGLAGLTPAQIVYPNVLEFSYKPPVESSLDSDSVLDAIFDRVEKIGKDTAGLTRRAPLAGSYYVGPINTGGEKPAPLALTANSLQVNIGIETAKIPDAFLAYAESSDLAEREGEDPLAEDRARFQGYLRRAVELSVKLEEKTRIASKSEEPLLGLRGLFAIMALYLIAGEDDESRGTVKNFTPLLLKTPISAVVKRSLTTEEQEIYDQHGPELLAVLLKATRGESATLKDLLVKTKGGESAGATVGDLISKDFKAPFVVGGKTIDSPQVGPFRGGRGDPRVRGKSTRRRGAVFETRLSTGKFTRTLAKQKAREMFYTVEILHMVEDQDLVTGKGQSKSVRDELSYVDRFRD